MIRLQYKPKETSRVWRNTSLTMHKEGWDSMVSTARELTIQEGWHAWRIVEEPV